MSRVLIIALLWSCLACQASETSATPAWAPVALATVVETAGEDTLEAFFREEAVQLADPWSLQLADARVTEDGALLLDVAEADRTTLLTYTEERVGQRLALLIGEDVVSLAVLQAPLEDGLQIAPAWADPVRRHAESAELLSALRLPPAER